MSDDRSVDRMSAGSPGMASDSAPEPGTADELMQVIGDRVFFGFDQHDLNREAMALVGEWAEWLNRYPQLTVTIEGHADERGTREYNLALGERRAAGVRNRLLELGVAGDRIETISYGKERPVDPGSNPTAWAKNRRGVMVLN